VVFVHRVFFMLLKLGVVSGAKRKTQKHAVTTKNRYIPSCLHCMHFVITEQKDLDQKIEVRSHQRTLMQKHATNVRFEILTAAVMDRPIFWDTAPYIRLKVNGRFGETCHLHIQDRIISQERKQVPSRALLPRWFLAWLLLRTYRWRRHVPTKCRSAFNGLHFVQQMFNKSAI
jgi:hypothetical protein